MSKKPKTLKSAEWLFEKMTEIELIYNLSPKLTPKQISKLTKSMFAILNKSSSREQ